MFIKCLLCAKHCSKRFTFIIIIIVTIGAHKKNLPGEYYYYYSYFKNKETEAQRS